MHIAAQCRIIIILESNFDTDSAYWVDHYRYLREDTSQQKRPPRWEDMLCGCSLRKKKKKKDLNVGLPEGGHKVYKFVFTDNKFPTKIKWC